MMYSWLSCSSGGIPFIPSVRHLSVTKIVLVAVTVFSASFRPIVCKMSETVYVLYSIGSVTVMIASDCFVTIQTLS